MTLLDAPLTSGMEFMSSVSLVMRYCSAPTYMPNLVQFQDLLLADLLGLNLDLESVVLDSPRTSQHLLHLLHLKDLRHSCPDAQERLLPMCL